MIVGKEGFKAEITRDGSKIKYKILEQSENITKSLIENGPVQDNETGWVLKSNKRPSIGLDEKTFYIRGSRKEKDNEVIERDFGSPQAAREAVFILEDLINKVDPNLQYIAKEGSTAQFRQCFLTRAQASALCVTDGKKYPIHRITLKKPPIVEQHKNAHFQEHLVSAFDSLSKAQCKRGLAETHGLDVNFHKVTPEDAEWAVENLQDILDRAEQAGKGKLVSLWRLMTALRSVDIKNEDLAKYGEEHRLPGAKERD